MNLRKKQNDIILEGVRDFDLAQTLECGQCFRFYQQDENDYVIVAYDKLLHIRQKGQNLIFMNTEKQDVENIWIPYFDLERDYCKIKKYLLQKDNILKEAIAEKYGVRILNQEFSEVLISFIISQNKQIPHIKQLVQRISERYGTYLGEVNGQAYYSFPDSKTLGTITQEEFREMKMGFRAPYLADAGQKLSRGDLSYEMLKDLSEIEMKNKLLEIKGVGEKVANCVMLFALGTRQAFPIDVWIKRIMETLYFNGKETSKEEISQIAKEHYGAYGGYAQQYLFCYGREHQLGK